MTNAASVVDEYYELWWAILQMRRTIYKARAKELSQYGMTPEQAAVFFVVKAIGYRTTPAEISRWLNRAPHTTSSLLNRMEREGLLRKMHDLERKNLVRVVMTEKGQQLYHESVKRESVNRIMSSLSAKERQRMRLYSEKLWESALKELGTVRKTPFPPSQLAP